MELQKALHSNNNAEKEEQSWRNHATYYQTILQSHSYQNRMVPVQKQTHRSMEQHREPRNKHTPL